MTEPSWIATIERLGPARLTHDKFSIIDKDGKTVVDLRQRQLGDPLVSALRCAPALAKAARKAIKPWSIVAEHGYFSTDEDFAAAKKALEALAAALKLSEEP